MPIKPASRPQQSEAVTRKVLKAKGVTKQVAILGVRGYYEDSMGKPAQNDRGQYDDAIFVVGPGGVHVAFNGNTDPSVFRKGIATLKPGIHPYKRGNHGISRPGGGYPALRPATPGEKLPVTRDGQPGEHFGIAINIHRGSKTSTSSEGCQTIHPDQYTEFITLVTNLLTGYGQTTVPYCLVTIDELERLR
jgi:lysozyme